MSTKLTGLEEPAELARRIKRWPALRNKPGDEKAYELAEAVLKLHQDVRNKTVEIEVGLQELAPLVEQVVRVKDGGELFKETRTLAKRLHLL